MQLLSLFLGALLAALHCPTYAKNPEDIKGILSDTIVSTPEICRTLCVQNEECIYSLYYFECDECWQLDCSLNDRIFGGTADYLKPTTDYNFYCNETIADTINIPNTGCNNLTASATVTNIDQPTETGSTDSAPLTTTTSLLRLGVIVAVVMALVV